ncbi:hypothetical protein J6590_014933 [Homalodisca vitripennis]|nr:hypothetical protein J6590_014933 [Homalodisca vitripennis]
MFNPTYMELGAEILSPSYSCPQCQKRYKTKGTMRRHIRYECGKQPQFACMVCPFRAFQKSNLLKHERCKHNISYHDRHMLATAGNF